jgi:hypothetical protein
MREYRHTVTASTDFHEGSEITDGARFGSSSWPCSRRPTVACCHVPLASETTSTHPTPVRRPASRLAAEAPHRALFLFAGDYHEPLILTLEDEDGRPHCRVRAAPASGKASPAE